MLSDAQVERYARQIVLPEIGGRGQERLLGSSVAIHGGGEGAAACAAYLAAAGVGRISIEAGATSAILGDLRGRNPDCAVASEPIARPDVVIRFAPAEDGSSIEIATSRPEIRATASPETPLVGALAAAEALRALVGLPESAALSIDVATTHVTTRPCPVPPRVT